MSTATEPLPAPPDDRLQRAAEYYAERLRWPIFPLHPITPDRRCAGCAGEHCAGKHPIPTRWERTIASVPAAHSAWRAELGDRGIGLACGAIAGVWVLDVDVATGGARSLTLLEQEHGALPDTWRARTGSGGEHVFFATDDDRVRNSAGQVWPGLDIRGAGGYVVLAPSPHRSGGRYEWLRAPWEGPLAQAPGWLAMLALQRPKRPLLGDGRRSARLTSEHTVIAAGCRHEVLVRFCGMLRSMGLGEQAIVECGHALLRHHAQPDPPMDMAQAERDMRDVAHRYPPTRPKAT
jgi:Bifunctional DNA primase/polymerase, N-terminal